MNDTATIVLESATTAEVHAQLTTLLVHYAAMMSHGIGTTDSDITAEEAQEDLWLLRKMMHATSSATK